MLSSQYCDFSFCLKCLLVRTVVSFNLCKSDIVNVETKLKNNKLFFPAHNPDVNYGQW